MLQGKKYCIIQKQKPNNPSQSNDGITLLQDPEHLRKRSAPFLSSVTDCAQLTAITNNALKSENSDVTNYTNMF